ncbi:MAG: NAD-dependent epimerase/dehydratase family protein [Candidatus Nanopelagicales bacterium]
MTDALVLTGGAGWFGRAFLAQLAANPFPAAHLRVMVNAPGDVPVVAAAAPDAAIYVGDVRSGADVADLFDGLGSHVLVHAAGIIHPERVSDFFDVNAEGTRRVVRTAVDHGLTRMVHVSSNSPIGTNPGPDEAFRDVEPYDPYLGYGRSKMAGEIAVTETLAAAQVPGIIVRPPWFYGPYQPDRQARFLKTVRQGKFPLVGSGGNRRSMVYVDNLADGVRLAAESQLPGVRSYWIADDRPHTMLEILDGVREAARLEGLEVVDSVRRLPNAAGNAAERVDRLLQQRGRYQQEIHVAGELNKTIACRIDGARRDLGYEPRVSLVEGMRRSYRWGLDNGQDV